MTNISPSIAAPEHDKQRLSSVRRETNGGVVPSQVGVPNAGQVVDRNSEPIGRDLITSNGDNTSE